MGRIGCFLNGDDYGVATYRPWGMAFPQGSPPIDTPVHPTQLYESVAGLAIFALLWSRRTRPTPAGALWFDMMVLMGLERLVVEFWRRNPEWMFGLTVAQWISLGLIVVGVVGRARLARGSPTPERRGTSKKGGRDRNPARLRFL